MISVDFCPLQPIRQLSKAILNLKYTSPHHGDQASQPGNSVSAAAVCWSLVVSRAITCSRRSSSSSFSISTSCWHAHPGLAGGQCRCHRAQASKCRHCSCGHASTQTDGYSSSSETLCVTEVARCGANSYYDNIQGLDGTGAISVIAYYL